MNIKFQNMKNHTFLLITFITLVSYKGMAQQTASMMTTQERNQAVRYLKETEAGVLKSVKGMTEAQSKFKTADDRWSAEECIKHVAAAETELWAMAAHILKAPLNPDKRAGIKMTDEDLIKAVEDRSQKSKTFAALEPKNSPYATLQEALKAFKENRKKLIAFMESNPKDLRNHILVLPLGTYDLYQFILLIAAHSKRHTLQIEEIKSDSNFPE